MNVPLSLRAFSALLLTGAIAFAQQSPPAEATITVGGKTITIKYAAPSVRGRKIFGDGGRISQDRNYPIWRAGANAATALHTDADLQIGSLSVPKGDYTLFVNLADVNNWELVISKQTGQWGLAYNASNDLGRVKMAMSKPPALVETLKFAVTAEGSGKAKIELSWENHSASVTATVK